VKTTRHINYGKGATKGRHLQFTTHNDIKSQRLGSHRVKKLVSNSHVHILLTALLILSIPDTPFTVPLPSPIRSWSQVEPASLLIPIANFHGTRYQSGSLSLTDVGSGFHCRCSFLIFQRTYRTFQLWSRAETCPDLSPSVELQCLTLWFIVGKFYATQYKRPYKWKNYANNENHSPH